MEMKKRIKRSGLKKRNAIAGYLFILPFIVGFLAFMVKPLIHSFYMSFCKVQLGPGYVNTVYSGLTNYIKAFSIDPDFNRMLVEEISRMCLYTVSIIVFSFFVALVLNQKFKGRAFVRAVFFLPVILSSGVMLKVESDIMLSFGVMEEIAKANNGAGVTTALQSILMTAGIGGSLFEMVFQVVDRIYDIAIASGIQIVIFLSGLQTISQSMYEAAAIEGCTSWESLWKITFPMISPLLLVNWIYTIVDFCMRSDNKVMEKVSETMIVRLDYGFSSAMAWAYFGIIIVIVAVSSYIISKGVYYYE